MSIVIPIISEFNSAGIDKAKKEFSQLEGAGAKAGYAVKKAAIPAAAAIAGLGAALFDATKGAIEDQAAQDKLAGVIDRVTGASKDAIAANEEWISTQGKFLGISDDKIRPAMAKLVTATGDITKAQELAAQAFDISAATGKPLEVVVGALEKAFSGNMTALQKLAPEYRTMIKDGATFEEVMAAMAATTGGAATDAANTAEGKFKRLGVALAETKESIGAALLPAIEAVLPFLVKMGDWAAEHPEILLAIGAAIAAIAVAIVATNVAMALNPFSLIALAVVGLGAMLVTAYQKFEPFKTVVDTVFGAMKYWINNVTIPAVKTLLTVFKEVFNGIASIWNNTVGKLAFKLPDWVPGIGGKGFSMPDIPMMADGGIVNKATLAVIGESGPEAVIPLSKMGSMGNGAQVTINVNGGDPNSVVEALRTYMRQNGSIPITVGA